MKTEKEKRRPGRPATGLSGVKLNLYLSKHAANILEATAKKRGLSKKLILEALIFQHLDPEPQI